MMKAVFLDTSTLGTDIDLTLLTDIQLDWTLYETTQPEQVRERIADKDIVVTNKTRLSGLDISQSESLKFICVPATGTNNVDHDAALKAGIMVSNCTAYGTASVSQHVFSLILALSIKLPEYRQAVISGQWAQSPMFCLLDYPVMELDGKTLGIVGYGELGRGVARIGEAFGMNILIANRPGSTVATDGRLPLTDLLPEVDVLSLHCPLTVHTENLIGKPELELMRGHALLINCARGGIVDESALATALKSGTIGGAGVDVLTEEPPKKGNPLLDSSIPNLIVTPHSAWASREARQRIVQMTVNNIDAFLAGKPQNVVRSQ